LSIVTSCLANMKYANQVWRANGSSAMQTQFDKYLPCTHQSNQYAENIQRQLRNYTHLIIKQDNGPLGETIKRLSELCDIDMLLLHESENEQNGILDASGCSRKGITDSAVVDIVRRMSYAKTTSAFQSL